MKIKLKTQKSKIKTEITNNLSSSLQYPNPPLIQFLFCHFAILLFVFCYLFFVGSCRDRVLPPDNGNGVHIPKLKIEAEDIGVTDCFIRLKFLDTLDTSPKQFSLSRDGQTILSAQCSSLDTLLLDEGLLPNSTYKYKAYRFIPKDSGLLNSTPIDSSSELLVPTLDTTSHSYNFEVFYLGDGNSSVLRDVCIINDTCVWGVGEIYKKDSTGQFETTPYNAARWDGKQWNLIRIQFRLDYGESIIYSYMGIKSFFAVSPDDIWFVHQVGGVTRLKDGQWMMMNFKLIDGPGGANKIWGTGSNNLYFVADLGRITHWNGASWRRLESGTDKNIHDIYGLGEEYIYLIGSNNTPSEEIKFMQLKNQNVSNLSTEGLPWSLSTIWFPRTNRIYIGGDGVYYKDLRTGQNWRDVGSSFTHYYTSSVRGTDVNDVFVVTHFGGFYHFNGSSWRSFNFSLSTGVFLGVDIKKNIVCGVGTLGGKYAFAVIGKRY